MVSAIKVYDPMNIYHQAMKKIESSGIRPTKQRRVLAKFFLKKVIGTFQQMNYFMM